MPDLDIPRLVSAMRFSRRSTERFRANRREMVRQFVGKHWSEEGTENSVPVNLVSLYVSTVGRNLIAKNPRVLLSTFRREHKPTASAMQAWANKQIQLMKLADTLQRCVTDALFSVGVCKVALASTGDAALGGWAQKAGQPFAERIDLDDFVFDRNARDLNECGFMGHRIRLPLAAAKKMYGKKAKDLHASWDKQFNEQGDERISMLGRGYQGGDSEEFEDMVDLWEVYLPRERKVVTLADEWVVGPTDAVKEAGPLLVQPWVGPYCGPYHILGMGVVPGNAMPKAPIQDLIDLHLAVNRIFRKLIDQSERQKEVVFVAGSADQDGNRLVDTSDGHVVRIDRPEGLKQTKWGGPDPATYQMAEALKSLFSYMAGNLDIMGGLSPQAKTLGQDRMLNENSSRAVADMQDRTITFAASVVESLCWYWHYHPTEVMEVSHAIPGLAGYSVNQKATPDQRRGVPFEDLEIKVDPYSMQHSTPQSRLQFLTQIVTQVVAPMLPVLQQQGINIDLNAWLQKVSEYADQPDLSEILTIQEPPAPVGGAAPGGQDKPRMPAATERTYNRVNTSEATQQGEDKARVATMMGANKGGSNKNGTLQGAGV